MTMNAATQTHYSVDNRTTIDSLSIKLFALIMTKNARFSDSNHMVNFRFNELTFFYIDLNAFLFIFFFLIYSIRLNKSFSTRPISMLSGSVSL